MRYKAVIIDTIQNETVNHFLQAGNIHPNQAFEYGQVKGMRTLLKVYPNWWEEYLAYGGIDYVLLRHGFQIVASGQIVHAYRSGFAWAFRPRDMKDRIKFRFECTAPRKGGIYCHPYHYADGCYVEWNNELRKVKLL